MLIGFMRQFTWKIAYRSSVHALILDNGEPEKILRSTMMINPRNYLPYLSPSMLILY